MQTCMIIMNPAETGLSLILQHRESDTLAVQGGAEMLSISLLLSPLASKSKPNVTGRTHPPLSCSMQLLKFCNRPQDAEGRD